MDNLLTVTPNPIHTLLHDAQLMTPIRRLWRPAVRLLLVVVVVAAVAVVRTAAAEDTSVDGHYEGTTLTRLAFGSCNKQWRNNTLWEPIVAFGPQAYLWLGDAVYVKEREGDNEANLRRAYTRQLASPGYKRLLATGAVVEGVYDDHDMSTNDGHRVVSLHCGLPCRLKGLYVTFQP